MATNKLKVQRFRANDLNNSVGKQFELGKNWCEDFFEIAPSKSEAIISLFFKPLCVEHLPFLNKEIELKLAEITSRGDRKAYANGLNGLSQIKNLFIDDLGLNERDNLSDYFAIYKESDKYYLYYIPQILYNNFIKLFESITLDISIERDSKRAFKDFDGTLSLKQIFYGAPGTGKSHTIKEEEKILDKDNVFRTTFHPDSDYASFVGAYKPTMSEVDTKVVPVVFSEKGTTFEKDSTIKENKIVYEFVPQVFLKAYIRAWQIWRGTTPSPETPKSVIESTTFGEIKVTIDGVTICEGKTMAESGWVLVEEYIKTRGGATSKDIVSEWNGIGIGSPDFRLLNEDADLTKKETWPKININGETYLFVKEIHAKLWKDFCKKTKELFEKYGKGVIIEDIEKPRKKKASDSSLVSPDESISQTVLLVIEEINRGNCAQIFGDIFQLLDRGDGFSEYPIVPDKDISDFIRKEFERLSVSFTDEQINLINEHFGNKDVATEILNGKVLVLPPNLFIWATMNTSDQSLFPIDSAFKRRWDWKYIPIGYKNEDWVIEIGGKKYKWVDFQRKINDKIYSIDSSEDKLLGDFFVDANRTGKIISADTLLNKILFYIWNDVCKDEPDQIFRWKDSEDSNKEKSIRFSDFFCDERDRKLQGFMSFLGVIADGEASDDE